MTRPTVDDMWQCVPLKPEFMQASPNGQSRVIGADQNRVDARREMETLVSMVGAVLATPAPVSAKKQAGELEGVRIAAAELRIAITNALRSIRQKIGPPAGAAYDTGGEIDENQQFLGRMEHDLIRLESMVDPGDALTQPGKKGKPVDARRTEAVRLCIDYWRYWSNREVSMSDDVPFRRWLTAVFEHCGQKNCGDLSTHVDRVLKAEK